MARAHKVERKGFDSDDAELVTIFGAGITGLAAAHELIERGFRVHVLEPTPSKTRYGFCEVGGMAASQYAHLDSYNPKKSPPSFRQVPAMIGTPQLIYFKDGGSTVEEDYAIDKNHITNGWREPKNRQKLTELKRALSQIRDTYCATPEEPTTLRVVGHTRDFGDPDKARILGLARATAVVDLLTPELPSGIKLVAETRGSSEPIGNNDHEAGRARNDRVAFEVDDIRLPGEHGYRFYPGFYHNLDDQLRRIPVYDDKGNPTHRSVLDNLQHAEGARFAVEGGNHPIRFDRRLPRSLEELRRTAKELADRLKFPPEDVLLFELKMLKFMTSSRQRRRREYEKMSWWDFVEGDLYHPLTQRHLLAAPQALVAMEATHTDAYTAGNIYTQLLLDHLTPGTRVDRTMNGPTTEAWLRHWKRYLRLQGVKFFVGRLTAIRKEGAGEDLRLVPQAEGIMEDDPGTERAWNAPPPQPLPEPVFADEPDEYAGRDSQLEWRPKADYYVLALPAKQARDVLINGKLRLEDLKGSETLTKLMNYDVDDSAAPDPETGKRNGPLRDFVGIQFYFAHDVTFTNGHTYYPDSDWGLSSISQLQYWKDRRTRDSRYLGVLSVDIGNMVEPDRSLYRRQLLRAERHTKRATEAARESRIEDSAAMRRAVAEVLDVERKAHAAAAALLPEVPLPLEAAFVDELRKLRDSAKAFACSYSRKTREHLRTQVDPNGSSGDALRKAVRARRTETADALRSALDAVGPKADKNDRRIARVLKRVRDGIEKVVGLSGHDEVAYHAANTLVAVLRALTYADQGPSAWRSDPDAIARAVWRQIKLGLERAQERFVPNPMWFHLDDNLTFKEVKDKDGNTELLPNGKPKRMVAGNLSPFHINPVGDFSRRPGLKGMPLEIVDGGGLAMPGRIRRFYEVSMDQWVVAGMFTKTYTRLSTMELAVESARHAVNAILVHEIGGEADFGPRTEGYTQDDKLKGQPPTQGPPVIGGRLRDPKRFKGKKISGDFCRIENPERHEIQDLDFLKRIDRQLIREGLPHFMDILGMEDAARRLQSARKRTGAEDDPLKWILKLLRAGTQSGLEEFATLESIYPASRLSNVRDTLESVVDRMADVVGPWLAPLYGFLDDSARRAREKRQE